MLFKRSVQRDGRTPDADTPYLRAAQVWDERIGSARVQAYSWRLATFASLTLSAILGGGLIWRSMQSRVVPYVVEVDQLGEARAVREAEVAYRPTDPQIAWHLSHFISSIRSISLDPVLMRRAWLEAYDFTTQRGAQFLDGYARGAAPFARIGNRTVAVQVTSVVRASERSFQLKWVEAVFERGVQTSTSRWTAILTVVTRAPSNADQLRKNPLGIYVDAVDWSRELETISPPAPLVRAPTVEPERSSNPQSSPDIQEIS